MQLDGCTYRSNLSLKEIRYKNVLKADAKGMRKINLLNVSIDNLSMSEFLAQLESGVVVTPNVDHMVKLQKDPEFRNVYKMADYRTCDSQVLLYASRFLGTPIKARISGSDLFPEFYRYHSTNQDIKIFLLGGAAGVASQAQANINQKVGRDIIIDSYSPSFGFERNEKECLEIVKRINKSGATVLAVGVGAPKQEKWIHKHKQKLSGIKIFLAIGATIDFEAGNVKRSPKWMSELGLEWVYRLLSEPRRLWKRYLVEDLVFLWLILQQKLNLYKAPTNKEEYSTPTGKQSEGKIETEFLEEASLISK